jgi:LPS-assembly protein
VLRVSDNDYWKDFSRDYPEPDAAPARRRPEGSARTFGDWNTYARVQRWQVLQTARPDGAHRPGAVRAHCRRSARATRTSCGAGFEVGFEGEFNRFSNPTDGS